MPGTVLYEIDEHVATITYNRPDARNAINAELRQDLNYVWQQFRDDEDALGRHRHRRGRLVLRWRRHEGRGRVGRHLARLVLGDPHDQLLRKRARGLEANDRGGERVLSRLRPHARHAVRLRDRSRRRQVRLPRGPPRRADDRGRTAPARSRGLVERDGAVADRRPCRRVAPAHEIGLAWKVVRAPSSWTRRVSSQAGCSKLLRWRPGPRRRSRRAAYLLRVEAVRFGETMRRVAAATDDATEGWTAAGERRPPEWRGR